MEQKQKATEAAQNTTAKVQKKSKLLRVSVEKSLCSTIVLAVATTTDPDPMDWNKLDSMLNKPPRMERKPRKAAYKKPEAVKKLERVTGRKHRDDTANGLTRCIIGYLHHKGWQAERINTTGIPVDTRHEVKDIIGHRRTIGGVTWRPGGSTVGSADISATIKGRSVKIEVKIGRDRQSEAQRQYQAAVEAAGGVYYIARNFTDFWRWYQWNFGQKGDVR